MYADVFLVDGGQRIPFTPLQSGRIDFSALDNIAHHTRTQPSLKVVMYEKDFNHRHLNFRLTTLNPHPVYTVLTEYSRSLDDGTYEVTFSDIRPDDGVMLQLFYQGSWYGIILGDPLSILHDEFKTAKATQPNIDALESALETFKEDATLNAYLQRMKAEPEKREKPAPRKVIDFKALKEQKSH